MEGASQLHCLLHARLVWTVSSLHRTFSRRLFLRTMIPTRLSLCPPRQLPQNGRTWYYLLTTPPLNDATDPPRPTKCLQSARASVADHTPRLPLRDVPSGMILPHGDRPVPLPEKSFSATRLRARSTNAAVYFIRSAMGATRAWACAFLSSDCKPAAAGSPSSRNDGLLQLHRSRRRIRNSLVQIATDPVWRCSSLVESLRPRGSLDA